LSADPIARLAEDLDLAPDHLGAQVHADVAAHGDAPARHAGANPLDPAAIAFDEEMLVPGVPFDREEFADRGRGVAVLYRQGGDLRGRLAGEVVGRETLRFNGDGRRAFVL